MLHMPFGKNARTQRDAIPLVGILSNCASTRNAAEIASVRRVVERSAHVFHFEFENVADIPGALAMFAESGVALLVINGGDGTIQATLSSIINDRPFPTPPPIAVLPGGKTNMIAADLGARGTPAKVLARLLASPARRARGTVGRSLITLDTGDGNPPRVGMFFGTAGVLKGILWTRRQVHRAWLPVKLAHFLAIVRLVFSGITGFLARPLETRPQLLHAGDGRRIRGRFSLVLATTLDRVLFRLRPFGQTGKGAIKFSAIESGGGPMRRALFALLTGRYDKGGIDGLHVGRFDSLVIEGQEPVTLDGEIYDAVPGQPMRLGSTGAVDFIRF